MRSPAGMMQKLGVEDADRSHAISWILSASSIEFERNTPSQFRTTAYHPKITQDITGLTERYHNVLRVRKIRDIIQEHSKSRRKGGLGKGGGV